MYKKVSKTLLNRYGLINSYDEFLSKPCVLGIVPMSQNQRLVNGYMSLFMYLLQIRKANEIDSNYDINSIPFDLLIKEPNDKIDALILNIIPSKNVLEAKKIMRNINIISYCNGNNDTGLLLNNLYQGLLNKGYNDEETKSILSQIFVLQIVDNYYNGKANNELPFATVVTVHDIYDMENTDYYFEDEEHNLFDKNPFIHLKSKGNNDRYVIYKSFGEGSLADRQEEHIFENDYAKAPIINYIMSLYLIKSLHMSINNIEINNNISLKSEIDDLIRKVGEFASKKKKNYNDFTKDELKELNEFLMPEIQRKFITMIPAKILTSDQKKHLDDNDLVIKKFFDANKHIYFDGLINSINDIANRIINLYYITDENKIVYQERTNFGVIEYRKDEAIKLFINRLGQYFENLINTMNNIVIPDGLTVDEEHMIREYINSFLDKAKAIISNDIIQETINQYNTSSSNNLRIK